MTIQGENHCPRCMRVCPEETSCPHCGHDPLQPSSLPFALEERTLLRGRYLLGSVIGAGGFGVTYAAWDRTLGIPAAIKEYFPREFASRAIEESDDVLPNPDEESRAMYLIGLDRFLREARLLAMLENVPGVVTVHDCFEANGTAYIVMEYLHGQTLGAYVSDHSPDAGALLSMLRQPIDALVACHAHGVLHRDVSPDNLIVLEDGTVKLIDFGAAAQLERRAQGKDMSVLLRRHYAPAEQYEAGGHQGPWTDVYAFCATLYALLHGEPAPEAPLRQTHDALPGLQALPLKKAQRRALERGMAVRPENRIQSMDELRARLYGLPLPEEVIARRRFVRRFASFACTAALVCALLAVNFTCGFPLGGELMYSLRAGGWHIVGAEENMTDLTLPDSCLGLPVCAVSDNMFLSNDTLKTVLIPGSIRTIGNNAFMGCAALESVELQEGVASLGKNAFASCPNLHTLLAPASLSFVGEGALCGAGSLMTVWGGRGTFAERLFREERGFPFAVRSEMITERNETGLTILSCLSADEKIVLPSYIDGQKVTQVSATAFMPEGGDVQTLFLPHTKEQRYYDLPVMPEGVRSIVFPQFMEEISCWGVRSGGLPDYAYGSAYTRIGDHAFFCAKSVPELAMGVTSIGRFAFYQTASAHIVLPQGLTLIEAAAFADSAIEEIILPASVSEVEPYAFSGCKQLRRAVLSPAMTSVSEHLFEGNEALQEVTLHSGIGSVGSFAFSSCQSLDHVILPESVASIGYQAFSYCTSLRYIYIPAQTVIGEEAFLQSNPDLIIAGYPGSDAERVARSGGFVFEDVTLWNAFPSTQDEPGTITIDTAAAPGAVCASFDPVSRTLITRVRTTQGGGVLTQVTLPLITEVIEEDAFFACALLKEISFPAYITHIGEDAFTRSGLVHVTLPDNLQTMESAFNECPSLQTLTIPAYIPLRTITGFHKTGLRHLVIPSGIRTISDAFTNCSLETVVVEEGCTVISSSFSGAANLKQIDLPASLRLFRTQLFGSAALEDVFVRSSGVIYDPTDITGYTWDGCFWDSPDVTLHGHPGSTTQTYSREQGLRFEPLDD